MLLKKIAYIFMILFFFKINAQKFELGKVSIAELEEKAHPKDPSAEAAILFNKGEVRFDFSQTEGLQMITVVKTRIKIYKKEGYEWANQKVDYFLTNNFGVGVSFSNAVTYNLVEGKIIKTKLKSDGEFDEKINKYFGRKKIILPNVKEKSIIEFEYTIKSSGIGSMKDWNFQTSIPVNYSEFITYVPEYFVYNSNQKGFVFPKVNVDKMTRNMQFLYTGKQMGQSIIYENQGFTETKTTYLAENLSAMKEETFVNNINNYISSISHELSMTKIPNSFLKSYSTDWESVVKTIYDYDDFGLELNKTGYFEDDINKLLTGINTQPEKIAAIFNYVKSSVKWNNYIGYTCNEGVKKAYKDKTGNTAEINLMLTSMLRFAGMNANPVLVSTRDNGIAFFPGRTAFNVVLAAVETPEGFIMLDATDKYSTPNILPLRDLNWFGRLIRKDGTSLQIDLMPKKHSKESILINFSLNSDGVVMGNIKIQFTDHLALNFRQKNIGVSNDDYLEKLENENNSIEISDYVRENELEISNPIIESYSFKGTKDIEIINDKIFVSPLLFLTITENPFKQEVREYPIDFGYPTEKKYIMNIEIPAGYVIESMPTAINLTTGSDIGSFKFMISNTENKIQIAITSIINASIVSPDFYPVLKGFYQQMIDKQNEKIILRKL